MKLTSMDETNCWSSQVRSTSVLYEVSLIDSFIFGYKRGESIPFILWLVGVKVLKIPNEVTPIQNNNYKTLNIPLAARFFSPGDNVIISTTIFFFQTPPSPVGLKNNLS